MTEVARDDPHKYRNAAFPLSARTRANHRHGTYNAATTIAHTRYSNGKLHMYPAGAGSDSSSGDWRTTTDSPTPLESATRCTPRGESAGCAGDSRRTALARTSRARVPPARSPCRRAPATRTLARASSAETTATPDTSLVFRKASGFGICGRPRRRGLRSRGCVCAGAVDAAVDCGTLIGGGGTRRHGRGSPYTSRPRSSTNATIAPSRDACRSSDAVPATRASPARTRSRPPSRRSTE